MAKSPASSAAAPASFEAALGELETIVRAMEVGQLPLEESLASYERGVKLIKYCQETLDAVEQKLQVLENATLRDFGGFAPAVRRDQDGGSSTTED